MNTRRFVSTCVALLAATCSFTAAAQPDRPLKLIVPFAAGGSADVASRALAVHLSERLHRSVVVENQASGQAAIQSFTRAAADGNVLLVSPSGPISITPHVKKLPYDTMKDLTAVGMLARVPAGLAVPAGSPLKSVDDLVKAGRESVRGLNFGVGTAGGHMHLMGELIAGKTDIKIQPIPYRGNSMAAAAAAAGDVDFIISDLTSLMPLVKGNRLRLLAVTDTRRAPMLPDVATIEEAGFPNSAADAWIGIFGPPGLPADVAERISAEIAKSLALSAMQSSLNAIGLAPLAMTPAEMKRFLMADLDRWGRVIKERGIKLE